MTESYCLKSCTECGREGCAGCRAGAFAAQCEIVKCCKEKNHESCETCTRGISCPTRMNRNQMPDHVFAAHNREVWLVEKHRADAAILAKWTNLIFWSMIVSLGIGLLNFIPAMGLTIVLVQFAMAAVVCYGFYRMNQVDQRFGTVAGLELAVAIMSCVQSFVPEEGALDVVLTLVGAVCGFILLKRKYETFRDALSGIDREMSEKWENQWKLFKIGLYILLGCFVLIFIPVLNILAVIAVFVGAGLMIFVTFREYVYLRQTVNACEAYEIRYPVQKFS